MIHFTGGWFFIASIALLAIGGGCSAVGTVEEADFGKTADGGDARIYTLRNRKGAEARITNYGGIVVSLKMPDRAGKFDDVVLGFDSLEPYFKQSPYFGAIVGRYANRIAKGKFSLDGKEYTLAINNRPNSLHGGVKGFDKVIWTAKPQSGKEGPSLELTYVSRDGEEGFPGTLSTKVIYTLTENDELRIEYSATTDKKTVVNLCNHSYFDLAGAGNGTVLDHQLMINADAFTPVNKSLIPTGEIAPVKNTPMDFTSPMAIGSRIDEKFEQLHFGNGYDHNYVLNKKSGAMSLAARVSEPTTGRVMEVWTTEPGVQFYTANSLNIAHGKGEKPYPHRSAFCLETQHFPDSPNQPNFPSVVLSPGETYHETTVYRFLTT
jgi:aldose 1-epimerase